MTSEGLGEMFEGDSADTCAGKFSLMSMGGRVEGLVCADPGARTPITVRGNFSAHVSAEKQFAETLIQLIPAHLHQIVSINQP